ncbi:MAG: hypothetical protein QF645_13670 [Planctomycetota bacterium]|nr:hypothetical protein [Planctomycetota bacterium]
MDLGNGLWSQPRLDFSGFLIFLSGSEGFSEFDPCSDVSGFSIFFPGLFSFAGSIFSEHPIRNVSITSVMNRPVMYSSPGSMDVLE